MTFSISCVMVVSFIEVNKFSQFTKLSNRIEKKWRRLNSFFFFFFGFKCI